MSENQTIHIGARIERRSESDRKRSLSKWGFVRRLDGRYAHVAWDNGIQSRVLVKALRPYQKAATDATP